MTGVQMNGEVKPIGFITNEISSFQKQTTLNDNDGYEKLAK